MNLLTDSSAATKRYLNESGSKEVLRLLGGQNPVYVCRLVGVEVASALSRRVREGNITPRLAELSLRRLEAHLARQYHAVEFSQEVQAEAMRVVTVGILRASDAIHVATALIVARDTSDLAFLTADRRQAAAAEAEGLTVVYVGE